MDTPRAEALSFGQIEEKRKSSYLLSTKSFKLSFKYLYFLFGYFFCLICPIIIWEGSKLLHILIFWKTKIETVKKCTSGYHSYCGQNAHQTLYRSLSSGYTWREKMWTFHWNFISKQSLDVYLLHTYVYLDAFSHKCKCTCHF